MDYNSILLILKLVSEFFEAWRDIDKLIKRVEAGEVITVEEIKEAQKKSKAAIDRWNASDEEPKDVA